jgi:hypothetical protein
MIRVALAFLLGALLGLLAKVFDNAPVIGMIGTMLGVWVMAAALLAAWSRSPGAAALHVFLFFAGLLIAYYTYSMVLFGFFPTAYFLAWGGIALLSPAGAVVAWYARGRGWPAAVCAAAPIALLLLEGTSFFYTGSIPHGFSLLAAAFLIVVFGRQGRQIARILAMAAILFWLFRQVDMLPRLFGGL